MLDLARSIRPELPAVAYVQKWRLPETTSYLRSIANLRVVCSRDTRDTEYSDERWSCEAEARAEWPSCEWLESDRAGVDLNYGQQEIGAILGLRADESARRRVHLRARGVIYESVDGRVQCNPIAWWSALDVWAYIHSRSTNYNLAYDVLERLGVPLERQRIAEFMIDRVIGYGTLTVLKQGWPDLFNRFAEAHPEARAYA